MRSIPILPFSPQKAVKIHPKWKDVIYELLHYEFVEFTQSAHKWVGLTFCYLLHMRTIIIYVKRIFS